MKKKPLKTFQEYSKMSGFDTELSIDLKDSLEDSDGVRLTLILYSRRKIFNLWKEITKTLKELKVSGYLYMNFNFIPAIWLF